jgi:hypothetical protein
MAERKINIKDLVFYKEELVLEPGEAEMGILGSWKNYKGLKCDKKGYYYPWRGMNRFADEPVKLPKNAKITKRPTLKWIKEIMYNPAKHHVVRETLECHKNDNWYAIHDNGGTPFIVYVNKKKTKVSVYRIPEDSYIWNEDWSHVMKDNLDMYTHLVVEYTNPVKVLIGYDYSHNPQHGNSILVECTPKEYTYIGSKIYNFTTVETITKYFSNIGNSDVPYPIAASKKFLYFMLDEVVLPKSLFRETDDDGTISDMYRDFYELPKHTVKTGFSNVYVIHERIW